MRELVTLAIPMKKDRKRLGFFTTLQHSIEIQDYRRHLEILIETRGNIPQARNLLLHRAHGKLILFWDSDVVTDQPNAISSLIPHFKDRHVVAAAHPYYTRNETWIDRTLMAEVPTMKTNVKSIPMGFTMVHRSIALKVGGFNETLEGWEDQEFCERISRHRNSLLVLDPSVKLVHLTPPTTMRWFIINNFTRRARFMHEVMRLKPTMALRVFLYLSYPLIPFTWHLRKGIKSALIHFIGTISMAYGILWSLIRRRRYVDQ